MKAEGSRGVYNVPLKIVAVDSVEVEWVCNVLLTLSEEGFITFPLHLRVLFYVIRVERAFLNLWRLYVFSCK